MSEVRGVGEDVGYGGGWSAGLRRAPEQELRAWLAVAVAACDEADDIARRHFRRELELTTKPDRTFVTQADTEVERAIRARILAAFPSHGLVGEEYGTEAADAATRWYIDPIDGTHNFMRGIPVFATLLAVEHDGELQVAVVSAPALRERWYATRGGGAWAVSAWSPEPRALRVSNIAAIDEGHVLYGSGRDLDATGLVPGFRSLLADAWRERGFGDFWGYALVAEGAAEVMVEAGLKPWDAAAPTVIIEEAGGRVSDIDGSRALGGATTVATNGRMHAEILERLRGAKAGRQA